jgi:hypothetical protein
MQADFGPNRGRFSVSGEGLEMGVLVSPRNNCVTDEKY